MTVFLQQNNEVLLNFRLLHCYNENIWNFSIVQDGIETKKVKNFEINPIFEKTFYRDNWLGGYFTPPPFPMWNRVKYMHPIIVYILHTCMCSKSKFKKS